MGLLKLHSQGRYKLFMGVAGPVYFSRCQSATTHLVLKFDPKEAIRVNGLRAHST
jgi:hypothetical protein